VKAKKPGDPNQLPLLAKSVLRDGDALAGLQRLDRTVQSCVLCARHRTRELAFLGGGATAPLLVLLGEAPVGKSPTSPLGQRETLCLREVLQEVGIPEAQTWIGNAVACQGYGAPSPGELSKCLPHLEQALRLLHPAAILLLGGIAASQLLGVRRDLRYLRNQWFQWEGIPARVTWHPAMLAGLDARTIQVIRGELLTDMDILRQHLNLPVPVKPVPPDAPPF